MTDSRIRMPNDLASQTPSNGVIMTNITNSMQNTNVTNPSQDPITAEQFAQDTKLFEELTTHSSAIFIVDASGSTIFNTYDNGPIDDVQRPKVFQRMKKYIQQTGITTGRFIFFNSDSRSDQNNRNFPGGVICFPHVVTIATGINQMFKIVMDKITSQALTFPHLGFEKLPPSWFDMKGVNHVYFITDGGIGWPSATRNEQTDLENKLVQQIRHMYSSYPNVQLHMIAIEPERRNYSSSEVVRNAAGGAVCTVLQRAGLTSNMVEFISCNPAHDDGFTHFKRIIPLPGFIPFGTRCFSELKRDKFVEYINRLIQETPTEDALLKLIQDLSLSISYLTKDVAPRYMENIIGTFCRLFNGSVLDPVIVTYMLNDTVRAETAGQTQVFAQCRERLLQLFRLVQDLLRTNTKDALSMHNRFITLPINGKILVGDCSMITKSKRINGNVYNNSSFELGHLIIPGLSFQTDLSAINQQAMRQFLRANIAEADRISDRDDMCMYSVAARMIQVVLSDVDVMYKAIYTNLTNIMLGKERLRGGGITELAYFEAGNLPKPNVGNMNTFYQYMNHAARLCNIQCKPMTMWYIICLALANTALITKQLIHCADDIESDFPGLDPMMLLDHIRDRVPKVEVLTISTCRYDYSSCPITLETTVTTGGYIIKNHITSTGQQCNPNYVYSQAGYDASFAQPTVFCPNCYTVLTAGNFEQIGPNVATDLTAIIAAIGRPVANQIDDLANGVEEMKLNDPPRPVRALPRKRVLIRTFGTVGAGKSTWALEIENAVRAAGGECFNEGTDKYNKRGGRVNAKNMVRDKLRTIDRVQNDLLVVIIDTCGENHNGNIMFGYNFTGWTTIDIHPNYNPDNLVGYLAWSLHNVLSRPHHTADTLYWLNPVSTDLTVCTNVHRQKASKLYGDANVSQAMRNLFPRQPRTVQDALIMLQPYATAYKEYLDRERPLAVEIARISDRIMS